MTQNTITPAERDRLTRLAADHELTLTMARRMGCTHVVEAEIRIIDRINRKLGR